jgi:hypothetical protein
MPFTKEKTWKTKLKPIEGVRDITRNQSWQIHSMAHEPTGSSSRQKTYALPANHWGGRRKKPMSTRQNSNKKKAQRREDYRQRIPIEGKFGQGKHGYRLNYIRAKRADTSVAWINSICLVMNLMVLLKHFLTGWKSVILIRLAQLRRPDRASFAYLTKHLARQYLADCRVGSNSLLYE